MKDIQQQIISYNKSIRSIAPQFIVTHDTGDPGASAQNEHDYFSGGNRSASADFFVDSDNIIQIIDTDNYHSWHCGDGHGAYGISNANSLGIEMCLEADGYPSDATVQNTLDLIAYLMNKYGIGIDNVVRHYDASRKQCPNSFSANNWARWWDFKDKLSSGEPVTKGEWKLSKDNTKWWYDLGDGKYAQDCWMKIKGKWYLFNKDGYMLYDWKSDEGKWYYLGCSNDGSMKTGWQLIDGRWYYFDESGEMQTGWQKIDDKWFYFSPIGVMLTGWIIDKGKYYCLYSDGSMIHDCNMYGYKFNSDGVATKLS